MVSPIDGSPSKGMASGTSTTPQASTGTERELAEIWCGLLELPDVGVLDNFFDLGGYSLLMHVMRDQIERRIGIRTRIVDLFEYPTVRALGRYLDDLQSNDDGRTGRPSVSDHRQGRTRLEQVRSRRAGAPLSE